MANPDRAFDKTHLSIDTAADRVMFHRDYIAHLFRWTHVIKHLYKSKNYQSAKIVDIGCGKEVPLARALYSNKMSGAFYTGIDLNQLVMPKMLETAVANNKINVSLFGGTDATELYADDLPYRPNIVTSFEAFEHMHPSAARALLQRAFEWLKFDGYMFFSTPNWNGSAAGNHINETKYHALGALIEDIGFEIEEVYGTFASITDYKDSLTYDQEIMFNRLRNYYDTNMLSALMAPMIDPALSRNSHWVLRKKERAEYSRWFEPLALQSQPWSQHKDWEKLNG
jgi:2-polyprenyl-3-methyl-5-hydroxy-6-metoxy-1,4-benzoquinol methylase